MNYNGEVSEELGGLGDVLPAEVLKKLNELLERLHIIERPNHGGSVINIYAAGSQHVDCIHTQNINIPNLTTDSPSKGKEGMTADYSDEQTTQAIDLKQSREAVAAVVEKARASGATRDKNWWFCIYAPMAELNNNENSKSCFWDSDERGEYKAFFVLMHQWLEEDTKDFIDEAWTKSFSSEKKTWKRVGMLDRCERNRTLTPHECWADYALKKRLKQWNEKQARKARTAYELWVALRSCVNSDNVINGT